MGDMSSRAAETIIVPFPEMFFGNNLLKLEHESGFSFNFNALDAIALVDTSAEAADRIKVSYAAKWTEKRYLLPPANG
jgi:type 2A phosphatase activator TIP41